MLMKFFMLFLGNLSISPTTRLRLAFLAPLAGAIAVLLGGWVALLYAQSRASVAREISQAQALMEKAYRTDIAQRALLLEAVLETAHEFPLLNAALARRDREALLRVSKPLYTELRRKFGVTHFYFTGQDRVNFLRVHQPERHGDVINRFTTMEAARSGATSFGMELGSLGTFTLRVVTPTRQGGQLLGYVELGVELDHILQAEQVFSGVPVFPLIFKQHLKREEWEAGMRMLGRDPDWDRFPDFVLSTQASEPMPAALAARLAGGLPAKTAVVEVMQGAAAHRVVFLALTDASGRDVGRVAALIDVSQHLRASRTGLYLGAAVGVFISAVLIGLFHGLVGRIGRQIEQGEEDLKRLAAHDGLTGLCNHREFHARFENEISRGRRFKRPVSLLLLDIDHFKRVNDTHGHQAGDAVLKGLSGLLVQQVRGIDSVCRYGGEEITIILPETDLDAAADMAERLRIAVEAFAFDASPGGPLQVTVSIGIASWPVHADNPQGLVAAADAALYVAKGEGRNRSVVASRPGAPIPEPTAVLPLIHLPWCDSYSLGHPVIDAQHMKLLALSNALLDAVSSGKDYPEVEAALDALLRHTQEHFSDEEKVLADAEYPHVQGHLDAHHHLLQTAQRMKLEFHQGRLSFRALLDFIVNRMVNDHMLQEDMAYKSWLIEHDGLE